MYAKFLIAIFVLGFSASNLAAQIGLREGNRTGTPFVTDAIDGKAGVVEGNVVLVHDGDSLTLVTKDRKVHRIQLRGTDSPEPTQGQAERSKENLAVMVQGMDVTVVVSGAEVDGTYFGTVYSEGLDVGLKQIELGLAWHSIRRDLPLSDEERKKYEQAEKEARNLQLGIWSDRTRVPPWEFRAGKRSVPPAPSRQIGSEPAAAAQSSGSASEAVTAGKIVANQNSGIYHWPGCSGYSRVAAQNRILFDSRAQAEAAGYRPARNCR